MNHSELNKKAFFAFLSILSFIVFYFLLIISAMALTALCAYGGFMLVALKPGFITIALGVGLAGMGVLVLIFLLKFLFKSHKVDRSGMIQITESDQPKLFQTIRELTTAIKTDFPKKIYISPDVNASVFYDSSFWSMFLPVRKNLLIGLGLVNSVTESELKAILAHEFGHFSQKSMKIGSYVYNVNQVIYNLLNENESYSEMVESWAGISGYFGIFAGIGVKIVQGIQWMLQKFYTFLNLSYLGLSREMEFHADSVAASVAGSKPLIDSLHRLELADNAYNSVLQYYDGLVRENKKTDNLYPQHRDALLLMGRTHQFRVESDLPFIGEDDLSKLDRSKIVLKDQWASHPSTKDRVARLKALSFTSDISNGSAWNYFQNKENLQKEVTASVFSRVTYSHTPEIIDASAFFKNYSDQLEKFSFDKRYHGFYDNRDIAYFEIEKVLPELDKYGSLAMEQIFNEKTIDRLFIFNGMVHDLNVLEQIREGAIQVTTFDYDGKKYKKKNVPALISDLQEQLSAHEKALSGTDIEAFAFFCFKAQAKGAEKELISKYTSWFRHEDQYKLDVDLYVKLLNQTQFMQVNTPFEQITANFSALEEQERLLKHRLEDLLKEELSVGHLDEETMTRLKEYITQKLVYFSLNRYDDNAISLLYNAITSFMSIVSQNRFSSKQALLRYQAELL